MRHPVFRSPLRQGRFGRTREAAPHRAEADTPTTDPRRWWRTAIIVVVALVAVALSGLLAAAAPTVVPPAQLAAVGPVDPANGFPVWYRDSAGMTVGPCIDPKDPLCGLVTTGMDPAAPVAFPGNFPAESFYMLASSKITLTGGGAAELVTGLEAAFSTTAGPVPGHQVTFGRVRIRIDTPTSGHYVVTHPYGVDEFDVPAGGRRSINFTEDVGVAAGSFTGALSSRINPFLTWDTGAVTGPNGDRYLGDPATPHKVTGSALATNEFRIDGPDIGGPGIDTITSDLFTLSGKIAKNFGVDPGHPTYTRTGTDGGFVDVFATSVPGEVIEATLPGGGPTTLRADTRGQYFARLSYAGDPPKAVQVSNISDGPATVVSAAITDRVVVSQAAYDATKRTLTVRATSSDMATPPALQVLGYGALDASGQQVFGAVDAPPQQVTVTSATGGSDSAPVVVGGSASLPNPVTANAGPDQVVRRGQHVELDGSATRNSTAMAWAQVAGPHVVMTPGASPAMMSFTAPDQDVALTFRLTAQGPGGPSSDDLVISVAGLAPPTAVVSPGLSAYAGDFVTLDGSGSAGVDTYSWRQVAGPLVALAGSDTARPSFTMPVSTTPLDFALTTTGPGGSATAKVTVTPRVDSLVVTQASYRAATREWRISGTATAPAPDLVTVRLSAAGTLVGTASVDTTGAWTVRVKASPVAPDTQQTIDVTTSRGGAVNAYPVAVTP